MGDGYAGRRSDRAPRRVADGGGTAALLQFARTTADPLPVLGAPTRVLLNDNAFLAFGSVITLLVLRRSNRWPMRTQIALTLLRSKPKRGAVRLISSATYVWLKCP
jgi:hypothetical protein